MIRVDAYSFNGKPDRSRKDYYIDFGCENGRGNKIIYNELEIIIPLVEVDPLFGPNTRILVNTNGHRDSGVCVAEWQDGKLVPKTKEDWIKRCGGSE